MRGLRFLQNGNHTSHFINEDGEFDDELLEAVAKRSYRYRFVSKWLDIPIEEVRLYTHDQLLVAQQEAMLFKEQQYKDTKIAINNTLVSILNQMFGKGGENNNGK